MEITLNPNDLLSVDEAADRLHVKPLTVWRWIKKGKLVSVLLVGRRLIPISEIDRVLAEQSVTTGQDRPSDG